MLDKYIVRVSVKEFGGSNPVVLHYVIKGEERASFIDYLSRKAVNEVFPLNEPHEVDVDTELIDVIEDHS